MANTDYHKHNKPAVNTVSLEIMASKRDVKGKKICHKQKKRDQDASSAADVDKKNKKNPNKTRQTRPTWTMQKPT